MDGLPIELVAAFIFGTMPTGGRLVCRCVCRRWRDALPRPSERTRSLFRLDAAALGRPELERWAERKRIRWDPADCRRAAKRGLEGPMLSARDAGCDWDEKVCSGAARRGHVHVLRRARREGCPWDSGTCQGLACAGLFDELLEARAMGCPWNPYAVIDLAVESARDDLVLRWTSADDPGGYLNMLDAFEHAARVGRIEVLEALTDTRLQPNDIEACRGEAWYQACRNGQTAVVRWMIARGWTWCEQSYAAAAESGSPEMLALAGDYCGGVPRLEFECDPCAAAAAHGRLPALKSLRESGWPWGGLGQVRDHGENTCAVAARRGHWGLLVWARQHGAALDQRVLWHALRRGRTDVLAWARAEGCAWGTIGGDTYLRLPHWQALGRRTRPQRRGRRKRIAARMEALRWARADGCPWGWDIAAFAASYGDLEAMRWLRDDGVPWHPRVCVAAAARGNLEALRWLRANGCPWDANTGLAAAFGGHARVLRWALDNGCPRAPELCEPRLGRTWGAPCIGRLLDAYHHKWRAEGETGSIGQYRVEAD